MKVLLFNNYEENPLIGRIEFLLARMNMLVEKFPVKIISNKHEDIKTAMGIFFGAETTESGDKAHGKVSLRGLVISPLSEAWFHFLAGFSCASSSPFLVYGEKTIAALPSALASCFRVLKDEAALKEYFEGEKKTEEKEESERDALLAREELLKRGVPLNEESLARCVGEGGLKDVSLFFVSGYSPNTRDKAGVPLLNISARKGNGEMLKLLIKSGADVEQKALDRGNSALIDSAIGKHNHLALELLEAGADVNALSKDGQSALIIAVGAGDEKMTELLLEAGADPDIQDSLGVSARSYAVLFHQQNIIDLFNEYAPVKVS